MVLALATTAWSAEPAPDASSDGRERDDRVPVHVPTDPFGGDGVVGGHPAKDGKWEDAVALMTFGFASCTGTLIGPKVVLTAGHCIAGNPVDEVKIGATNWWTDEDAEVIRVERMIEYPNSWSTYDIGLVLLEKAAKTPPRAIAMDCVLDEYLENGADVQIVGFGVTRENGTGYNSDLNEAPSRVLDKGCKEDRIDGILTGCNESVRPGGEIAAGGNGTDACYGDSGGPLYLRTDEGDFVVGVTSRAFLGVDGRYPCRDGGIWVRPDAVIDWIEENVGNREITYPSCNEPVDVTAPELVTKRNQEGETVLVLSDPDGDADAATVEIVEPPAHGTATLDGLRIVYAPDADYVGADSLVVAVTDSGTGDPRTGRPVTAELHVPIVVGQSACGCSSDPSSAAWTLMVAGLLIVRRRR